MPTATTRLALPYPLGTDPDKPRLDIQALATALDTVVTAYGQGVFASRPVSTPASPGKQGRVYLSTDGATGGSAGTYKLFYDYGTGWVLLNPDIPTLGPDSITATEIAPNAVGTSELGDNSVDSGAIIDAAVTFAKLAAALKPSQGAAGAVEALRALGTGAANAAAGNDVRLSDQRVPLDNSVSTIKLQDGSVTSAKIAGGAVTGIPSGAMVPFAGAAAPGGWLLCDGAAVSRATYAALFSAIGTAYGPGDGSSTFNLPDLRGRIPVGVGANADVSALGGTEGEALANRRPKHKHNAAGLGMSNSGEHGHGMDGVGDHNHTYWETSGTVSNSFVQGGTTFTAAAPPFPSNTGVAGGHSHGIWGGGDHAHNINGQVGPSSASPTDGPAYQVVNYIIKV